MRDAHSTTRVTEAQLSSIVDSATDAIISTDERQHIILFNRAAEEMFARTASETLGQPLDVLIPERYRTAHEQHMRSFADSGITVRSMRAPGQLVGLRATGEEFPIEAMISHADTDGGRIFTVIIRDITERMRAYRARDEFLATLAHELRNPLGAMANAIALIQMTSENRMLSTPIQILDRQVAMMARLVNDLVDVSRITRGKIELQFEEVDLAALVRGAVESMEARFQDRGQSLTLTLPDEPVILRADPVRLNQVLTNLLDNATKFTPPGGHIRVQADREAQVAVVRIRDTGEGIRPEFLPRIFEPFVQGDPSAGRAHGGLGIGLALSHRIMALHSGSITAESAGPGQGTEMVVSLPLPDDVA